MGYFSNGSMGMDYEAQYCDRCIHGEGEFNECEVWGLHFELNYAECNKPDSILHRLIPKLKGPPFNGKCKMFMKKGEK